MARQAAVDGAFYEAGRESLLARIKDCFLGPLGPGRLPVVRDPRLGRLVGLVSPHAGYMYSGSAAAHAYDALAKDGIPEVVVLLGPNHRGFGAPVAVSPDEEWQTPLGAVRVDTAVAKQIERNCESAQMNEMAHLREHSIEVQLPFLQYVGGSGFRIVPISLSHRGEQDALLLARELGPAIGAALADKSAVIIASTDFSHEEPQHSAQAKDALAIEQIIKLDGLELIRTVHRNSITICGVIGTAVMLEACKALGATTASKLTYYTSGDVTGEFSQVVGYGALSVERG